MNEVLAGPDLDVADEVLVPDTRTSPWAAAVARQEHGTTVR